MINDELHVVLARVAGLDIHKIQTTASLRPPSLPPTKWLAPFTRCCATGDPTATLR